MHINKNLQFKTIFAILIDKLENVNNASTFQGKSLTPSEFKDF